jgi:hypothetical protein
MPAGWLHALEALEEFANEHPEDVVAGIYLDRAVELVRELRARIGMASSFSKKYSIVAAIPPQVACRPTTGPAHIIADKRVSQEQDTVLGSVADRCPSLTGGDAAAEMRHERRR